MRKRDNYTFLTSAPVHNVILTMAVPTIISMLVTSVYNIVTTFYVGRISTQATAAVGIAFSVMSIIQAVGFTFGQGSGNYISRELGAQRHKNASRMASTGFFCAVATGFVICLAGQLLLEPLALLLGSTPTILPHAKRYLSFIFMAAPFMCGALCLNNQMRFQGNAAYAMFGILTGAVINVFLAPLLIFVFGMGITGAGLSTFVGETSSMFVLLWMTHKGGTIRIHLRNFTPRKAYFKEILAGGTPSFTRQGMASVSVAMLNVAAGRFGDAAIAGMSIVGRVMMITAAALIGIGQGFQPVLGYNWGAKKFDRVKKAFDATLLMSTVVMTSLACLGFIFAREVIGFFETNDPEVFAVAVLALKFQCAVAPLVPVNVIGNMTYQVLGRTTIATLLASTRQGLFFLPMILLLPPTFGLIGLQSAQPLAEVGSFLICGWFVLRFRHEVSELAAHKISEC